MIDYGKELQKAYDDGYKARDAEIVRCKDCVHRIPPTDYCEKLLKSYVPDDFFCFYGEPKEQEDG